MASASIDSWSANSAFGHRAFQCGGQLTSLHVESHRDDMMMQDVVEARYTFRIRLNHEVGGMDEFEDKFLRDSEYDEMKRIVNDNPELKLLYEKYKMIDRLAGK